MSFPSRKHSGLQSLGSSKLKETNVPLALTFGRLTMVTLPLSTPFTKNPHLSTLFASEVTLPTLDLMATWTTHPPPFCTITVWHTHLRLRTRTSLQEEKGTSRQPSSVSHCHTPCSAATLTAAKLHSMNFEQCSFLDSSWRICFDALATRIASRKPKKSSPH